MSGLVRYAIDGPVATLTLDRPEKHNALTGPMVRGIHEIATELASSDVQVVVVRGEGPSFCAGADIASWKGITEPVDAEAWIRSGHAAFGALGSVPAVTIAALHGHVLGGGLELAMHCDLRIAAESARVGLPELSVGAVPGWGGLDLVERAAGRRVALELAATAVPVGARTARELGLVSAVVPDEDLGGTVAAWSQRIGAFDPAAIRELRGAAGANRASHDAIERDVAAALSLFVDRA